jgi:hypothetical protein
MLISLVVERVCHTNRRILTKRDHVRITLNCMYCQKLAADASRNSKLCLNNDGRVRISTDLDATPRAVSARKPGPVR